MEARSMFIDLIYGGVAPKKRDIVASLGKYEDVNSVYLVLRSIKVQRRDENACHRFRLTVKLIGKGLDVLQAEHEKQSARPKANVNVFNFKWYPRKKKTFEQHMKRAIA